MKFHMRKGYEDCTIRIVTDNKKKTVYGVVGTVGDMLKVGLLEWCDYSNETWCFLSRPNTMAHDNFGKTLEEAVSLIME